MLASYLPNTPPPLPPSSVPMPSPFFIVKRDKWTASRRASQASSITLVYGCGVFCALFECASLIASVIGDRELQECGDGINEMIPYIEIPFDKLQSALTRLIEKYSVALIDIVCEASESRFCLLWKIEPSKPGGMLTLEDVKSNPGSLVNDPFF